MRYTKKQRTQIRNAYRKVLKEMTGLSAQEINNSIYLPEDDNGQWSPDSMTIINYENGLPNPYDIDLYYEASRQVYNITGISAFIEPINGAVGAVWD